MSIAATIQDLYARFGRLQGITIECQKELVAIGINNSVASAEVFIQGAQVARFKRKTEEPLLFLSAQCKYQQGQPLRGGIPICWPWFGKLDKNKTAITSQYEPSLIESLPSHGFIRALDWQVDSIEVPRNDLTIIEFSLQLNNDEVAIENSYKKYWPYLTALRYRLEIGKELIASLSVSNQDSQPFSYSAALHSYFSVDHINNVIIHGFSQTQYIDALDEWSEKNQIEDIAFNKEIDRIYKSSPEEIVLTDRNRLIKISSEGSESTVVWNPWLEKSESLSQFSDEDYKAMVCIETANVLDDIVTLKPNASSTLRLTIS